MISNRIASPRDASVAVRLTLLGALFLAAVFLPLPAAGQDASALKRLALEDLMEVDVTSVSRRTEPISEAPAAIDVITGDQIRRSGVTNGLETEVTVRPTGWMRWQASWTMFDKHLEVRPGSGDLTGGAAEGNGPPHQLGIRTAINLPHRAELEGFLRRVAALPDPRVPAYTELDTRASWPSATTSR